MTEAQGDLDTGWVAGRRGDGQEVPEIRQQIVDRELAERLVAQAREAGVDLVGPDGLLRQMTKAVLERSLAAELTDHLGYVPGIRPGPGRATTATAPARSGWRPRSARSTWTCRGTVTPASTRRPSARGSAAWTGSTSW